MNDMKQL